MCLIKSTMEMHIARTATNSTSTMFSLLSLGGEETEVFLYKCY